MASLLVSNLPAARKASRSSFAMRVKPCSHWGLATFRHGTAWRHSGQFHFKVRRPEVCCDVSLLELQQLKKAIPCLLIADCKGKDYLRLDLIGLSGGGYLLL
jgi:hypothetical protein